MRALLRPLIALTLLTSGGAAVARGAALQPAAPPEIVAAASTCLAAAKPGSVDAAALTARGWAKGEASDGSGKAVKLPFDAFSRKDGKVVIIVAAADGNGMCSVVARIDRVETASAVANALSAEFKVKPFQADKEGIIWFADGRLVQLAATGDRSKPSVRISLMQQVEKAK
jgi:hypothetical protein